MIPTETTKEFSILIVDDNQEMLELIDSCLIPYYETIKAMDGLDGFEQAKIRIPDLILTDINMPGKDGLEFCKLIKANIETSHIPVIMITAKALEEEQIKGYESGATDYIVKPFLVSILLLKIKNLLETTRQLRKSFSLNQENFGGGIISDLDKKLILDVTNSIDKNYKNIEFGVDTIASEIGMSKSTLYRKLKAITGKSAVDLIQTIRLKKAKELLLSSGKNVSEIAYEVGYTDPGYFSSRFKEHYGILPSDVSKNH